MALLSGTTKPQMSKKTELIDELMELYGEPGETLKCDGYDNCVISITSKGQLVYSIEKIIHTIRLNNSPMTNEEAFDWFWFNIENSYHGDFTPIYIYTTKIKEE